MSLLAIQCARLFWVVLNPVDPVGEWKTASALNPAAAPPALLESFDPFFRGSGGGPLAVTSLDVKLFGIRENRATGGGAAFIALPDGEQHSFAVSDEIMPGVILVGVTFGSATITRNGIAEQLFLEEFGSASDRDLENREPDAPTINFAPGAVTPGATPTVIAPPPASGPPAQYQPRMNGTQVTGIIVQPAGDGTAFRATGLQPGDVVVSVNGQRITSAQQVQSLGSQLGSGDVNVQVERGGRTVPLRLRVNQ